MSSRQESRNLVKQQIMNQKAKQPPSSSKPKELPKELPQSRSTTSDVRSTKSSAPPSKSDIQMRPIQIEKPVETTKSKVMDSSSMKKYIDSEQLPPSPERRKGREPQKTPETRRTRSPEDDDSFDFERIIEELSKEPLDENDDDSFSAGDISFEPIRFVVDDEKGARETQGTNTKTKRQTNDVINEDTTSRAFTSLGKSKVNPKEVERQNVVNKLSRSIRKEKFPWVKLQRRKIKNDAIYPEECYVYFENEANMKKFEDIYRRFSERHTKIFSENDSNSRRIDALFNKGAQMEPENYKWYMDQFKDLNREVDNLQLIAAVHNPDISRSFNQARLKKIGFGRLLGPGNKFLLGNGRYPFLDLHFEAIEIETDEGDDEDSEQSVDRKGMEILLPGNAVSSDCVTMADYIVARYLMPNQLTSSIPHDYKLRNEDRCRKRLMIILNKV